MMSQAQGLLTRSLRPSSGVAEICAAVRYPEPSLLRRVTSVGRIGFGRLPAERFAPRLCAAYFATSILKRYLYYTSLNVLTSTSSGSVPSLR